MTSLTTTCAALIALAFSCGLPDTTLACPPTQGEARKQEQPPTSQQKPNRTDRSVAQLLQKAKSLTAEKKFAKALAPLKEAAGLAPKSPAVWMQLANGQFIAGKFKDCIASYDHVIELDASSQPHLWQRGLALYYANEFELGKAQFETHQKVNSADVENSVWHLLCAAKIEGLANEGLEKARANMIPIEGDARIPMAEVFKMFAGKITPTEVLDVARDTTNRADRRKYEYYAFLYIGLYEEMLGHPQAARKALAKAATLNPYQPGVLMGQVARVHLELRDRQSKSIPNDR